MFLNAGFAFVVAAPYSASCPANNRACETQKPVISRERGEFKPLFARHRSSLDVSTGPRGLSTEAPCFVAAPYPRGVYRPFSLTLYRELPPVLPRWTSCHVTAFRHDATLIVGLGCFTSSPWPRDHVECCRPTGFTGLPLLPGDDTSCWTYLGRVSDRLVPASPPETHDPDPVIPLTCTQAFVLA